MIDPIPCPWCKTAERLETAWYVGDIAQVQCRKCCCRGPVTRSEPDAVKAWNRASRPAPPLPDAVCDRLIEHYPGTTTTSGRVYEDIWGAVIVTRGPLQANVVAFPSLALAREAVRKALTGDDS